MLSALRDAKCAPLLPNLKSVTIQRFIVQPGNVPDFVQCISPPSLQELSLEVGHWQRPLVHDGDAGEEQKLLTLAKGLPLLQQVTLQVNPAICRFAALAEAVVPWSQLRSFEFRLIPPDRHINAHDPVADYRLLHELSRLPVLEELVLQLRSPPFHSPTGSVWISGGEGFTERSFVFRALRRLRISARDTTAARAILDAISSPALRELDVATLDLTVFTTLISDIRARPAITLLTKLTLSGFSGTGGQNTIVPASALHPLTHLHQLRYLSINAYIHECPSAIAVGDVELEMFTRAWPQLCEFRISDGYGPTVGRTVQTLVHLARHCPTLWHATTTLDDNSQCWPDLQELEKHSDERAEDGLTRNSRPTLDSLPVNNHLTHLRLHHSSFADDHLDILARVLAKMFPRLCVVTHMVKNSPAPGGRSLHMAMQLPYRETAWKKLWDLISDYQRLPHS